MTSVDNVVEGKNNTNISSEFLNPNSMLTPGFAGGMAMMITNTVCSFFATPVPLTGLAVSGLFGILVAVSAETWMKKGVYYILNTLVIFCVAMGSGNLAHSIQTKAENRQISFAITSKAHAQTASSDAARQAAYIRQLQAITNNSTLNAEQKIARINQFNAKWSAATKNTKVNSGFFKSWSLSKN